MKPLQHTPRLALGSAVTLLAAVAFAGCAQDENPSEGIDADTSEELVVEQTPLATAELENMQGDELGQVEFREVDGGLHLTVDAKNLEEGFYGLHIHEVGECEADSQAPEDPGNTGDFLSAGSHIAGDDDADHPDHAGDLPTLLVNEDSSAHMSVVTHRLDESILFDFDGAAVVIHANADNFANVPDRYLEGDDPDDDTLSTGDAGDRLGCGVIEG